MGLEPLLATYFVRDVLRPVARLLGAQIWQFIDDILLADTDPHFLRCCLLFAIHLLEKRGFLINAKSVTVPTFTIVCLGKEISSSPPAIRNSLDRVACLLLYLFQFFASTFHVTRLRKLLGLLQWLSRPASESAPFLASAYKFLRRRTHPRHFPLHLWSSLIQDTLLCARAAIPRPRPPALTFAPIFVDAAAQTTTRYRVGLVRPHHYMTTTTLDFACLGQCVGIPQGCPL